MKYIIYPHNGSGDHGSEARLRSLLQLLAGTQLEVFSDAPQEDLRYWPHPLFSLQRAPYQPYVIAQKNSVLLAFQGDHPLLFPRSVPHQIQILLGACVPEGLSLDDCTSLFARYQMLIAYEHHSFHELSQIHPNVIYYPDPLFISASQSFLIPSLLANKEFLLLSIHPEHRLFDSSVHLIQHILATTHWQVALVPFLCQPECSDQSLLLSLYQTFCHTGRVVMVRELSSKQIHHLCSRARFVVTSHPSQAVLAYTSGTPTLLIHDSPRALHIAEDLFGPSHTHVASPKSITDSQGLIRDLHSLIADEHYLQKKQGETVPIYQEQLTLLRQTLYRSDRNLAGL
ncbi:MAG: polysaccharide pyruvyl transferase family protein [Firmicutes bacterium]|nr:polysaccharide pyruvyl transferase family protein [Bacillota bacterium]